ncbi:hypothetical protein [Peptoniphilus asaccharolyticus]
MSVWRKRKLKTYEDLPELRRQAFVDCIMKKSTEESIVGTFGSNVNQPLIYAYGLYSVPIEGLDSNIYAYGDYIGCDLIKSTIIYLKTEKCPLLFSSNMYVVEDFCPYIIKSLREETQKPVYVYNSEKGLRAELEAVYHREYSKDKHEWAIDEFKRIDTAIDKLHRSNLTGREIFLVEFFSRYLIDLEERREFLEETVSELTVDEIEKQVVPSLCVGGIYRAIDKYMSTTRYILTEDVGSPKFACKGCFKGEIKFNY